MDEINNFQCIDSDRMRELQPGSIGKFSHCDIITDKTLPIILFPMENVRSESALLCGMPTRFRRDVPLQYHHP